MTLIDKNSTFDEPRTRGGLGSKRRSRDEIEDIINSLIDEDMRRTEELNIDVEDELQEGLKEINSSDEFDTE